MPLIHFHKLTASQEEYLANLWVHMSSGCGQYFLLLAAQIWTHTEPPNVTGEETVHVYGPTGDSNRGPLAYRARTKELHARRPVKISICLIRFIPESTRNHAGPTFTVRSPTRHKMSKGRGKNQSSLHRLRIEPVTLCMQIQISTPLL